MASFTLHGIPVSKGIAIGRAHLLAPAALDVKHYLIPEEQVEAEVLRLKNAIAAVHQELQTIRDDLPKEAPPELGAFIDVHALILSDPMLAEVPLNIIRHRYYNAEWALVTQIDGLSAQFDEIEDPYLRERKADIQQVGDRVLKVLTGTAISLPPAAGEGAAASIIVVAHDISPADMLQFRDGAFAGFVTDLGGQNSHTAIVARSLDIPAAVGMNNASVLVKQEDVLIIDGDAGVAIVNPSPLVLAQYRARQERMLRDRKKLGRLKKTPAITQDGTQITLLANIELPTDSAPALEAGANGVGLFRSEFLFMGRAGHLEKFPSEDEQFDSYCQTVVSMKGRPVTIRTLDVGADKPLDEDEQTALNPALGLRAIRYCLSEPQMFLTQLRAILRASAFGPIKLLIPMMAHAFEIDQTLALIEQAKEQLRQRKQKFDEDIEIGAMIEIPAAALALPMFIKRLDFLSIGTNDLIQYTLAIDRVDHEVAHLYDPLHPAVLFLLSSVISMARKADIPVAVCGEMAGDVKWTRLLLGMGLLEFSMHPSQLLSVKQEILNSDLTLLEPQVKKVLKASEPSAIEAAMAQLRAINSEPEIKAIASRRR
ncbi:MULTISPECIES: phosphoenolpyruvate--protein phosphotransferase [unclassified Herbaspirillum]|uniref:phosphoenolpyruvate--protein phosphotransferase n=1 Tax=unclassified Herbaspirillum TaxID=2624150 RepID=UPI000E2E532F|nr:MULTISPECIES: phosphoenolpyruvate--protein phosphotransferase [unclassified Herbaspirillum]RFB67547.1 phosphoenolpyruvate--protein phosphotransferase [Herbaspirillum sp. 3R-3a1]TFI05157.1 phosphoenolpyruvate--protein phosphotransferase [Herbaspirillum sp. 3R11]TFI12513.1 phosphoenolpyruvate--protein phosphotransferase [Herbaspirillum sp. 3R-11]TFI28312.1 phosphoenolpyruvate--protein phosphotransferase [Herbaspirillum sp. 3C11]